MTTNLFRTILTWAAIAMTAIPTIFMCTVLPTGGLDCSASWIGPKWSAALVTGFLVLNQVIKAFDGTGLAKSVDK